MLSISKTGSTVDVATSHKSFRHCGPNTACVNKSWAGMPCGGPFVRTRDTLSGGSACSAFLSLPSPFSCVPDPRGFSGVSSMPACSPAVAWDDEILHKTDSFGNVSRSTQPSPLLLRHPPGGLLLLASPLYASRPRPMLIFLGPTSPLSPSAPGLNLRCLAQLDLRDLLATSVRRPLSRVSVLVSDGSVFLGRSAHPFLPLSVPQCGRSSRHVISATVWYRQPSSALALPGEPSPQRPENDGSVLTDVISLFTPPLLLTLPLLSDRKIDSATPQNSCSKVSSSVLPPTSRAPRVSRRHETLWSPEPPSHAGCSTNTRTSSCPVSFRSLRTHTSIHSLRTLSSITPSTNTTMVGYIR